MKLLYILATVLVVGLILAALSGPGTGVNVDSISIFGNESAKSEEIISGSGETGDIFGGEAAAQGNIFGDLGST